MNKSSIFGIDYSADKMTDRISKEKRSHIMSMIRGRDTKPELMVRRYLFHHGFRYRVNVKRLPGRPDIVLRKYKTAIFVNGCFWHGHEGCKDFRPPRTRVEWWRDKLERNKARDARVREELKRMGWKTMVIWECQLKPDVRVETLENVVRLLQRSYVESNFKAKFTNKYSLDVEEELPSVAEGDESYGSSKE